MPRGGDEGGVRYWRRTPEGGARWWRAPQSSSCSTVGVHVPVRGRPAVQLRHSEPVLSKSACCLGMLPPSSTQLLAAAPLAGCVCGAAFTLSWFFHRFPGCFSGAVSSWQRLAFLLRTNGFVVSAPLLRGFLPGSKGVDAAAIAAIASCRGSPPDRDSLRADACPATNYIARYITSLAHVFWLKPYIRKRGRGTLYLFQQAVTYAALACQIHQAICVRIKRIHRRLEAVHEKQVLPGQHPTQPQTLKQYCVKQL